MFLGFFLALRGGGVPVSLREHLTLIEAVRAGLAEGDVERFHALARACLVKDERHFDRFDRVFGEVFQGLETVGVEDAEAVAARALPEEWLRKLAERHLTEAEKAEIAALGGFEALMETLRQRLAEQEGRHQGGSKWIGTAGASPFGAYGYNPEGVRIGQHESRHRRAVKVWDRREFRDYDDERELGLRAVKIAMKRLRRWARDGASEELDLDGTIAATARQGYLDLRMRRERRNAVRVLLLMDVGGSMDDHVGLVADLFSGAKATFRSLGFYYFHNCLYERVWAENRRRYEATTPTLEILNRFGPSTSVVFVGDAAMSPYELTQPGGSVEHFNAEPGLAWLARARARWPKAVWLNPTPQAHWRFTPSIGLVERAFEGRMFPATLDGVTAAMKALAS